MFYLTKRDDEKQCAIGEKCMVLADFSGVPAGTKGIVCEVYDEGLSIAWIGLAHSSKGTEDHIRAGIKAGNCYPAAGFDTDGFSRDELIYLAFETKMRPDINPQVSNILHYEDSAV